MLPACFLARALRPGPTIAVLVLAAVVLIGGALGRGTEYDENYTIFLAAGTPRPAWPETVFTAGSVRHFFVGHSTAAGIARDLRRTDVHPPLYFWMAAAWRGVFGPGLLVTRLASVLCSVLALLLCGVLGVLADVPPLPAMLLTLGSYGFAYTGLVARGFALAELLTLAGSCVIVRAERRGRGGPVLAMAGGLLLGLASFTNYLAAFIAAAVLLWLLLRQPRRPWLWLAAGLGFAAVLPFDLWFFLAQRDSRPGQFPPFQLLPALARLAQYAVASLFGGLPRYFDGFQARVVAAAVVAAFVGVIGLVICRWRRIGAGGARLLCLLCCLAMPLGLLALGLVFDTTPIELRYLAFAMPFLALLLAGAATSLGRRPAGLVLAAVFAIQALSLAGMATRPETMQPQRQAAREAADAATGDAIVLLPHGNDGVGVVAAFVSEAPDGMRLRLVDADQSAAQVRALAAPFQRVVLVTLGLDGDSRATVPVMQAGFADTPCWKLVRRDDLVAVYDRACATAQTESGQK